MGDEAFDYAAQVVFHHEGFYSNDPDDPGGPTTWGWSLRTAKALGDLEFDFDGDGDVDIRDMIALKDHPEKALALYKSAKWDPYHYDKLPLPLSIKTFDLAINMGAQQAHKLLQRSVRATGPDRLVDDGIIGKDTIRIIKEQDTLQLVAALRSHAAGFYTLLAHQRPRSRKYLNGWLNRAYF